MAVITRRRVLASAAGALAAGLAASLTGCVGGAAQPASEASGTTTLHLVGFAVPKEANNAIQKKFAETPQGKGVVWQESYGASGDQSRAVVNGLKADYVNFSLEGDVTRLVKAGLVADSWNSGPTKGIVSDSVVVIVVPKGNPQGIKDWADLTKPGVKIITPNPASSGSARWNILAAYQQVIANGGSEADAKAYLTKFFDNVVALPGSGRDATNAFLQGSGNVLISYENEAILARQSGEDFDYIVPDATLKIENPGAVLKDANPKATDYLNFVLSTAGQEEFVKKGFRPVIADTPIGTVEGANDPSNPFPVPSKLFTIADLGGWTAVNEKFFDEKTGVVPQIQAATGKSQ
ncbi:sulfate ABC transporter substrate-binding protein [Microlunatus ginsengisoli]|uniref:Sulfate ABC transporter substrate-binding protein n=1 Tax=Microlunatus ginsengisoli TaxID=363863 RepID=A0ABP6ZRE6_9ACTN